MKKQYLTPLNCFLAGFLCLSPMNSSQAKDENQETSLAKDENQDTSLAKDENQDTSFLSSPEASDIFSKGLIVDLRDPTLENGILSTTKGGIISSPGLRIQAKNITYTQKMVDGESVLKVEAEEDLMLEYGERIFIGKRLEYDFNTSTGTVYDGTTSIEPWFIGGAKVLLKPEGEYSMENSYITTCESNNSEWQISARDVLIPKSDDITANSIQIRYLKLPLFWLPSFKGNIRKILKAPLQTRLHWGGARGSRITMRYRFLSREQLDAFIRLDYRLKRGIGGGVDINYHSKDKKSSFLTRNYVANDSSISDPRKRKRYRFEGKYSKTLTNDTFLDVKYDKLSDIDMPADFDDASFNLETAQRTELLLQRLNESWALILATRVKINSFQSLKEELPTIIWRLKPFNLGETGVISENIFKASYLNFAHSNNLGKHRDFESARLQMQHSFYRPIPIKQVTFTPTVGLVGTFYDKSPSKKESIVSIGILEGKLNTRLYKIYDNTKHTLEPYIHYSYYKSFEDTPDEHFIFDFDDSWSSLNMVTTGIKNTFHFKDPTGIRPALTSNIYANTFFNTKTLSKRTPKIYADFNFTKLRNLDLGLNCTWDSRENQLGHYNIFGRWTKSENLALSLEHRSREHFDFRKADKTNFLLESLRSEDLLSNSILSDKRKTLLTNVYYRFAPTWIAHFQSRHGYKRPNNPAYDEFRLDLSTKIRCNWRAKISYQLSEPDDHRLSFHISLEDFKTEDPSTPPLFWP